MKRLAAVALFVFAAAAPLAANPTGAPLVAYPVEPCRVLDTRVLLGPLASSTAMSVFVRGSLLPASQGAAQADCGIPAAAEAVLINFIAVNPTANGYLKINGTGFVHGPNGPYSRLHFQAGQVTTDEIQVSLCNVVLYPVPHEACPQDGLGRYLDLQVIPWMPVPGSLHLVADVVGYLERAPLTAAVSGVVTDKQTAAGNPPATELTLHNGLRIVCTLPWSDHLNCEAVQIGWMAMAAGHVVQTEGLDTLISIYAHGAVRVDQR